MRDCNPQRYLERLNNIKYLPFKHVKQVIHKTLIHINIIHKRGKGLKNSCIGEGEGGEQVREAGIKLKRSGDIYSTISRQGGGPHA